MSKIGLIWAIVFSVLISTVAGWYIRVRRPQIKAATAFLDALCKRDVKMLKKYTHPDEFEVYRSLYMKNGYYKHLIKYGKLDEKNSNNYFFPTKTQFAVTVEEGDMFFGQRSTEYLLTMVRTGDDWQILQFASPQDYGDLEMLKQFEPVQIH